MQDWHINPKYPVSQAELFPPLVMYCIFEEKIVMIIKN